MQTLREHSETEFASIFDQASTLAQKREVSIDKPRTVKKGVSVYRQNSGDAEQGIDNYYKINMFLPLLDGIVSHIRQRFGVAQRTSLALSRLIPSYLGIYRDIEPAVV